MTLPAEVRHELGLLGRTELLVEVAEGSEAIILRPAVVLRREDAWAYLPAHRELLGRAHAGSREGRARRLSENELE